MYRACGGSFFTGTCDPRKEQWVKAVMRLTAKMEIIWNVSTPITKSATHFGNES